MDWKTLAHVLILLSGTLSGCSNSPQQRLAQQPTSLAQPTEIMPRFTALPTQASPSTIAFAQAAATSCPVSLPNGKSPPADPLANGFDLGNDDGTLFTIPWPEGKVIFRPGGPGSIKPDGSLSMKWPWYRHNVKGQVTVEGRRLDAPATPLRAILGCCYDENTAAQNCCYGDTGFTPSTLIFSAPGCWEITGSVGTHRLTFVTLVVKLDQ